MFIGGMILRSNREEVIDYINALLDKQLKLIQFNLGSYIVVLIIVTLSACIFANVSWFLVLVALGIFWVYHVGLVIGYNYYRQKLIKILEFTKLIVEDYLMDNIFSKCFRNDFIMAVFLSLTIGLYYIFFA